MARNLHQHLDYRPLVNARAHRLGQRREIVNDRLLQQYRSLLTILSYQRELNDDQLMAVTYYLLIQDRIEEALAVLPSGEPGQIADAAAVRLLHRLSGLLQPGSAARRTDRRSSMPTIRWIAGGRRSRRSASNWPRSRASRTRWSDPEDQQQTQTELAATEANFDFQVEAKKITIRYQNLNAGADQLLRDGHRAAVQPQPVCAAVHRTVLHDSAESHGQPGAAGGCHVDRGGPPRRLQNSNVLVEVTGGGKTRSQAYYANSLDVQVVENYGQIQVRHQASKQPLGKVYVKVYARMKDGSVEFYKDGYTDLRGRFDYTSLSTDQLDAVARFSLLIFSEENGAVIREADPPKR